SSRCCAMAKPPMLCHPRSLYHPVWFRLCRLRMNAHLAEISAAVEPGAHAVLLLDQAGWHTTAKLKLPDNITILPLPAKAPELNPVENIWQFMRDNWLSNRIFESYDQIVALCSKAWNRLRDQPWRVMSIGLRDWAHE
ncbi:MAG: transposase, partial [Steroidobacteraceae bacterium]